MITFPNCKINLGLKIISKRQDGYHNIETVFYPVGLTDILEIVEADDSIFGFSSGGIIIDGDPGDNLCVRACLLMKNNFDIPEVKIYLYKAIPSGAGLGGGSADASFTIRLINEIFNLKLTVNQLTGLADQLGSDCAFFIQNRPVLACERGNIFKDSPVNLKGYYILIIFPGIPISTAKAYSNVVLSDDRISLSDIVKRDVSEWHRYLANDFETYAFTKYPVLNEIKKNLYTIGAEYASMSGSGSSIYGLFKKKPDQNLIRPGNNFWYGILT
jgi:4-diphosphocytidyl-2-C-methyl-D-erythritol kinase